MRSSKGFADLSWSARCGIQSPRRMKRGNRNGWKGFGRDQKLKFTRGMGGPYPPIMKAVGGDRLSGTPGGRNAPFGEETLSLDRNALFSFFPPDGHSPLPGRGGVLQSRRKRRSDLRLYPNHTELRGESRDRFENQLFAAALQPQQLRRAARSASGDLVFQWNISQPGYKIERGFSGSEF